MSAEIIKQVFEVGVCTVLFLVFLVFLKTIMVLSSGTNEEERLRPRKDDFQRKHGYSYDYVFVFNVYFEDEVHKLNEYQQKYTMKTIVDRCTVSQIETKLFYSCQRDEIYCKLRVDMKVLLAEADRIDYKLLLDKDQLKLVARAGSDTWQPINITDEFRVSPYEPYEYIYAKYDQAEHLQHLYKMYPIDRKILHPLRPVDRIKLLISILEAKQVDKGCGLELANFLSHKVFLAHFPLQDYTELDSLQTEWLVLFGRAEQFPVGRIKDYFGERIGLYFVFLQFYIEQLRWIAFLGLFVWGYHVFENRTESVLLPYFAAIVAIWTTLFNEGWKKKQSLTSMEWGVQGFEDAEQDRVEFVGEMSTSPINGSPEMYFSPKNRVKGDAIIIVVSIVFVVIVFAQVSLTAYLDILLNDTVIDELSFQGKNCIALIIGVIISTFQLVLDRIYEKVAFLLNDLQNHRTDTQYEDSLVGKIFSFRFLNSYAYLTYVAFIKPFSGNSCINNDCFLEMSDILLVLIVLPLLVSSAEDVIIRTANYHAKFKSETTNLEPGRTVGIVEAQYILSKYKVLDVTFKDYSDLVILYGYTAMFVIVFPAAPLITFFALYLKGRIDGWKLCRMFRRPQPKTAEDIGVWQDMVGLLGIISVVYTYLIIFFSSKYLVDSTWRMRWVYFIVVEHFTLLFKYLVDQIIDDVPEEVQMQLDRQEFLVSKVINGQRDEAEEDFKGGDSATPIRIQVTDNDWIYPEDMEAAWDDEANDGDEIGASNT